MPIETDSFADSNVTRPKWDEKEEKWVESTTTKELQELNGPQKDLVNLVNTINFLAVWVVEIQLKVVPIDEVV